MDDALRAQLTRLLEMPEEPRRAPEAVRLWQRVARFISMGLTARPPDESTLEAACYALQLPITKAKPRPNLRQRCQEAAELLVGSRRSGVEQKTLDRIDRLLADAPQKSPLLDEARLLADAVNLDDFGVTGLLAHSGQLAVAGAGVAEMAAAMNRREQYGYWEARLKDGFHFDPIARLARRRLEQARQVNAMLNAELAEDRVDGQP